MEQKVKVLDPSQLRANQIAKEHKERFEKIAKRLFNIVIEEKVTVVELPVIISIMTSKINHCVDEAEIEQIVNLKR